MFESEFHEPPQKNPMNKAKWYIAALIIVVYLISRFVYGKH